MKNGINMFLSIFLSISAIIVAAGVAVEFYMRNKVAEITKNDMRIVVDIADRLIVDNINNLYFGVSVVASLLSDNNPAEWDAKLANLNRKMPDFLGISVVNSQGGKIVGSGKYSAIADDCIEQSVVLARERGRTISSTHLSNHTEYEEDEQLVFHISEQHILRGDTLYIVGTIDGMFFSNILNRFTFWESGHLNMNDAEGYVISNSREEWVRGRHNFLKIDPTGREAVVAAVKRMVGGETGYSEYALNGVERIIVFRPISIENLGWSISLIAPKNEGPFGDLNHGLTLGGILGLILGLLVALVNGIFAQKTFCKMEKLRNAAINASQEKSRFLSNMSHEMRTPLNAIIGFSELVLGSDKIEDENKNYVENIHNSGITLLGIINDILDLSKIEAGKYEIVPAVYDCASVINDVISTNIVKTGSKDIDLRVDCDPEMFAKLNGDNLRVKQIFNNILSNALKYTEKGYVKWKISAEKTADGLFVVSSIEDTGIGIKEENLAKLFSAYSQVDTKSNRKVEGTGLGLSITKKLLEYMGGDIKVESRYGKGSKFTFRFKQGFVSNEKIGKEVSDKLRNFGYVDFRRNKKNQIVRSFIPYAKVLIVDDNISNLEVAKGLIKPYGMEVDVVLSGKQAIEKIRKAEKKYDAIFMDHMMPEMDGMEAVRIIRSEIDSEYAKSVPIIAFTANAMMGNDEMFLNAGFDDFLSKPIDIMRLDAIINRWCRVRTGLALSADDETQTADTDENTRTRQAVSLQIEIDGLDVEKALEFLDFDHEIYLDTIKTFVLAFGDIREKLEASFAEKDLHAYSIGVHGLKSNFRMVGAFELGKDAETLEAEARGGNWDFVEKNHGYFLVSAELMLKNIDEKIKEHEVANPKDLRTDFDKAVFSKLIEACRKSDIDGIDSAMKELESFRYEGKAAADLEFLRKEVLNMSFKKILEKFEGKNAQR